MLKLPGIGTKLTTFSYTTNINNNILEVEINFQTTDKHGNTINRMQNYELFADDRHPSLNTIRNDIDMKLTNALGYKNCVIKLYEERVYVYIDSNQYSGRLL